MQEINKLLPLCSKHLLCGTTPVMCSLEELREFNGYHSSIIDVQQKIGFLRILDFGN